MSMDWGKLVGGALTNRPHLELPHRLKLPVVPQSVFVFTSIAEDPEASPQELAAPIEADPTLSLELLRQINSIGTGLRQRVASVPQAITLFGPRRTKTLVLSCALQNATSGMKSRLVNAIQFQKESQLRAVFARETAREIGCDPEVAYMAGLLQDFLLPLLTEAFYSDYVRLFEKEPELVEKERGQFGWDHAEIAAGLMHDWGFPDELVACVLLHHDAERIGLDVDVRESCVSAAIAAASLPESLCQSPQGIETLLFLEEMLPEFHFSEVTNVVDELINADLLPGQNEGLSDRLNNLVMENLEQRRLDRVQQHRQLGDYILEQQIGKGGMGLVFRARHCMLKRQAAIKVVQPQKLSSRSLSNFESEVQLTCQLTNPHTIAVYDYGVTSEGLLYYAMEYLDGINLGELVKNYGPLPAGRVIHLLKQVCSSLAEAHAAGLIHRDLKPENLMVCCRGGIPDTLKVLDFGLAQVVSVHSERDQIPVGLSGTPLYMPPEVITAPQTIEARSDLYSLGAVAYFLLTGSPVFSTKKLGELLRMQVSTTPQPPSCRLGTPVDADLEHIVLQCLAKDPASRPKNAQELSRMLGECTAGKAWSNQDAAQWWSRRNNFVRADQPILPGELERTMIVGE